MVRLVLMAAGQATRMKQDKLALSWRGETVLAQVIREVLAAKTLCESWAMNNLGNLLKSGKPGRNKKILDILVVARRPAKDYLPPGLQVKLQESGANWFWRPEPMPLADTIRTGLNLIEDFYGVCFLPGDQIGVNAAELAGLIHYFLINRSEFLIPIASDLPCSPVFFRAEYFPCLAELQGENGGKTIYQKYPERCRTYQVNADFADDLDTPDEYNRLRAKYSA